MEGFFVGAPTLLLGRGSRGFYFGAKHGRPAPGNSFVTRSASVSTTVRPHRAMAYRENGRSPRMCEVRRRQPT